MTIIVTAREMIDATLEPGTFVSWDTEPVAVPMSPSYAAELETARERTGLTESVVTGAGRVGRHPVAVVVGEFGFLGGSIGVASADRVISAIRRATREGLPVLAAPVSGGTRMQEGTAAFVQMVAITQAIIDHTAAQLPYLVYLRHPTTGGVFASWGSLGHVTAAQPGALIGFLGPRVYEALHGQPFPEGVQSAENLYRLGMLDAVVPHEHLASLVDRVLTTIAPPTPALHGSVDRVVPREFTDDWESIALSRVRSRPGVRSVLRAGDERAILLHGTASGAGFALGDRGLVIALARFHGHGVVVIGHDRRAADGPGGIGPGALRAAQRGVRLAEDLGLPVVTLIDTPGADLSREAEEGGLAGEIARCLVSLATARVPVVSVLLGEGAGGGALALLPADRTLVARHGWLAPLPPEGASAIVHRTTDHAADLARAQGVTARHLLVRGIADELIDEYPSADTEPEGFARRVAEAIARCLDELSATSIADRRSARTERFDRLRDASLTLTEGRR